MLQCLQKKTLCLIQLNTYKGMQIYTVLHKAIENIYISFLPQSPTAGAHLVTKAYNASSFAHCRTASMAQDLQDILVPTEN